MTTKEGCQGYILEGTLEGNSKQIVLYCPLAGKCPAGIGEDTTRRVFAAIPTVFDKVKSGYRNDFKNACPKGTPSE